MAKAVWLKPENVAQGDANAVMWIKLGHESPTQEAAMLKRPATEVYFTDVRQTCSMERVYSKTVFPQQTQKVSINMEVLRQGLDRTH